MKLNLWLIANRLINNYDIECRISAGTERTISGPLSVKSTGTVYVRHEGPDIICLADQGEIIIHDVEEKEGLLLIQSIFNWYDTWLDNIEIALRNADFRMFVHLCAQAFSNPVLVQDSNSLLLGIDCRGLPIRTIPEWKYIYEEGQSSLPYYLAMADALSDPVRRYGEDVYRFNTQANDEEGRTYRTSGLLARFRFLAHDYGRITILEKKRLLNSGDVALLTVLAEKTSLLFAAMDRGGDSKVNQRVMNDLLENKEVSREQLDYQHSLIARSAADKTAQLCLFLFRYDTAGEKTALIGLLSTILNQQYPTLYSWTYQEDLLCLVHVPEYSILAEQMVSYIRQLGYADLLRAGVSLPFSDLGNLACYYQQAVYAIGGGRDLNFFYDRADRYLLENVDLKHKIAACEPLCRQIWMEQPDKREFLLTLAAYLSEERSTALAAERLYIHRNTVNYRVRYLKEETGWDYEKPSQRDYLRLSIYYLGQMV